MFVWSLNNVLPSWPSLHFQYFPTFLHFTISFSLFSILLLSLTLLGPLVPIIFLVGIFIYDFWKGNGPFFFHSVQITSSRWYLLDNTPFPSNLKLMSFIAGCPQNFHSFTYSHIHSFSKIYESSLTYCNYAREGPGIQWWANIDGPCFHAAKNLEKGYSREGTL